MTDAFEWLEPWYPVADPDMKAALAHQLQLEISAEHVLFGQAAELIARRADTDDALFALSSGAVAEVHLTWKRGQETDPRWPATGVYRSIEEWARDSMLPLHSELSQS